MANGIRTGNPRGFNKGRSSKFRVGSRVRQTPEVGRRTYQPKRRGNNNKDEDNRPKTLNHQALSQKFDNLGKIHLFIEACFSQISDLFFNIVHLAVHTLLPSVLKWLDPTGKKKSGTGDMT